LLFLTKEALVAKGWVVMGSCGYTPSGSPPFVAGMDGVDRWVTADNVGGRPYINGYFDNFSWIVLRNTAISAVGAGYQICISVKFNFYRENVSPTEIMESDGGGFVGGAVNARPTASDEVLLLSTTDGAGNFTFDTADVPRGFNLLVTPDRKMTRILFSSNGGTRVAMWCFEHMQSPKTWLDRTYVAGGPFPLYANCNEAVGLYTRISGARGVPVYLSADGLGTAGALGKQAILGGADPNGNWMCSPVGCVGTLGLSTGYIGLLADAYWVHQNMANGDYYPNDGTRQWVVVGDIMHASDGGAVVLD
jgi:hypothetical protein